MRVRSLDVNGDWNFGKGREDYLLDNNAIVQNLKTRLQSFLGDCFFDIKAGIDWFTLLGSKNQLAIELAVRAVIFNTEGVTGIISSSVTLLSTRELRIQYTVETVYSQRNITAPIQSITQALLTEDGFVIITEDGDAINAG